MSKVKILLEVEFEVDSRTHVGDLGDSMEKIKHAIKMTTSKANVQKHVSLTKIDWRRIK